MKTYGKEPESLDAIIEVFNETLMGYSWERINAAMTEHAKTSVEFPTPADIVKLLKSREALETAANRPERQIYQAEISDRLPKAECERRAEILRQKVLELSPEEKIRRTIEAMEQEGAKKEDIEAFKSQYAV